MGKEQHDLPSPALYIRRRPGQSFVMNPGLPTESKVFVERVNGDAVDMWVHAPLEVKILREELLNRSATTKIVSIAQRRKG